MSGVSPSLLLRISAHRPSAGPQSRKFQRAVDLIKKPRPDLLVTSTEGGPQKPWMTTGRDAGSRRPPFPPTGDREWLEPRRSYLLPTPLGRHNIHWRTTTPAANMPFVCALITCRCLFRVHATLRRSLLAGSPSQSFRCAVRVRRQPIRSAAGPRRERGRKRQEQACRCGMCRAPRMGGWKQG